MNGIINYTVFKSFVKGKKVAIVGVGVSNLPLIKFFTDLGAWVMCCDRKTLDKLDDKTASALKDAKVELRLGDDILTISKVVI